MLSWPDHSTQVSLGVLWDSETYLWVAQVGTLQVQVEYLPGGCHPLPPSHRGLLPLPGKAGLSAGDPGPGPEWSHTGGWQAGPGVYPPQVEVEVTSPSADLVLKVMVEQEDRLLLGQPQVEAGVDVKHPSLPPRPLWGLTLGVVPGHTGCWRPGEVCLASP